MPQSIPVRWPVSHAIDRQEIIDLVLFGQGEPYQAAPRKDSGFYHERLATQYLEYDVDLANEYLDKAGFSERDRAGYRLGPDGNRISITIEVDDGRLVQIDMLELIENYWNNVGIETRIRPSDRSLWEVRVRGGSLDFDASAHGFGGGTKYSLLADPSYYVPTGLGQAIYGRAWGQWYVNPDRSSSSGLAPQEPPAATKRQLELWDKLRTVPEGTQEQVEIINEILDIAADQFYMIGISTESDGYGIAKNNFRNVPETMPWSWAYPHPAPTNTVQYFWDSSN